MEIEIVGFAGKYTISDRGHVRSRRRQGSDGRVLKPQINNGYLRVSLRDGAKRKFYYVHQLVAVAFLGNPDGKPCVNHIDGNKLNNAVENLEWCTYSENMKHAVENGLNHVPGLRGDAHPHAKLSSFEVRAIREAHAEGVSAIDLSRDYGVTPKQIHNIISGKHWRCDREHI